MVKFFRKKKIDTEQVFDILRQFHLPDQTADIVTSGAVKDVQVLDDGAVFFAVEVDPAQGAGLEDFRQKIERAVLDLDGVKKVNVVLTAQRSETEKSEAGRRVPDPHGMNKNPKLDLPIKRIIAVASGKGGVGKSTIAANLAVALAQRDMRVGLLDADIYGPSQPKMMGLEGQKPAQDKGGKLIPPVAYSVKVMSIGFMVEAEQALIWRGPMVQTAIYQLLRDVAWGTEDQPLDVLVVDMPPGTGDAQLTMAQKVSMDGAIIVSTPQDIALIDARKAVEMFRKTDVQILGVIENMSTHICSNCGHEEHVFGHGGAQAQADMLGVPFLGDIPLSMDIRLKADAGAPIASDEGAQGAQMFDGIAKRIKSALEID